MRLCLAFLIILPLAAREPLAKRITHTDPSKYAARPGVHAGAGTMQIGSLAETGDLDTNLYFIHRGVIPPKSGIGHHFHNQCEEMFLIFDGEAQFTVNGRTTLLKGPAGAPCRMGSSHAVYNPTDKPVQWMNINVAAVKGAYDAFDLRDPRIDVQLDPIAPFMTMSLDQKLLRPLKAMFGGEGEVQYRRVLNTSVFLGPWAYLDHLVIPPGASAGKHMHNEVAEFYYVMGGEGSVTVSSRYSPEETAPIKAGDAVPIQLSEIHSFANKGTAPLELMILGVSRDSSKRVDVVEGEALAPRRRN